MCGSGDAARAGGRDHCGCVPRQRRLTLPPIATFGVALALGVVCAFVASTLVVGALHVVVDARRSKRNAVVLRMPKFSERLVPFSAVSS